jgi:hypothetical protein
MVRPKTKNRNKQMPFRMSEEEYKLIREAWQDSTLPFSDFILLLIPLYWKNRNKVKPQEKWAVSVKPKRR